MSEMSDDTLMAFLAAFLSVTVDSFEETGLASAPKIRARPWPHSARIRT